MLPGVEQGAPCPWTRWRQIRVLPVVFWLYTDAALAGGWDSGAPCCGALLQFFVRLMGVGWIHLRVLSLVLLLRVPAFIGSSTTLTAFRIWLLSLLERSCLNVSAVLTR